MDNETSINADPSRNAVSVYRADGPMDDFPVLKAFQQYIDSEQNKARKRLVTLCVFFGAMICVVIAVFMVMLHDINQRNQLLNDRLVEYAMKDRDRAPVVVQQPVQAPVVPANGAATDAALKAMTETLVALQRQLAQRHEQNHPSAAPARADVTQASQSADAEGEIERKERLARERIRKERAQLAEERRKLAEERERKHQEEVERHRRRLYPEYYAAQDKAAAAAKDQPAEAAPAPAAPQKPAKRKISDDDIADILREAALPDEEEDAAPAEAPAQQPARKAEPQPARKVVQQPARKVVQQPASKTEPQPAKQKGNDDVGDAIEYFSDDEYEIPVEVKGSSAKWRVPLD